MKTKLNRILSDAKASLQKEISKTMFLAHTTSKEDVIKKFLVVDVKSFKTKLTSKVSIGEIPILSIEIDTKSLYSLSSDDKMLRFVLTEEERASYEEFEKIKLESDDFVEYDIRREMFEYAKSFDKSFKIYARAQSVIFADKLVNDSFEQIKNRIIEIYTEDQKSIDAYVKVQEELIQVDNRRLKLSLFIQTEQFNRLSSFQKNMLNAQMNVMSDYCNILSARLQMWFKKDEIKADNSQLKTDDSDTLSKESSNENTCVSCGEVIPEGECQCVNCGGQDND